jgi:hypothetical protein
MKLMHLACQNVHQVNILTAPTSVKLALINVFFAKQHLNALYAEKLSLFLLEIKSGTTTSTSSVKNNVLIVTIKIPKIWMIYFVEVVPLVAISALTRILALYATMDGTWTHSNKRILQMEALKFRISVSTNASQDSSPLIPLTTGSVSLVWANVSVVTIPHIVLNVLRDMCCSLTQALFLQLTHALINAQMAIMLTQRMSAKDALITARHATTTILAKFATLGLLR